MIKRLLTPSLIPKLAMRRCVLGKTLTRISRWSQAVYSLRWPKLTKNFQTDRKDVVRWRGQTQSAWFIQSVLVNERLRQTLLPQRSITLYDYVKTPNS